ncbi:unnamed protein product [Symbiodinium sp. KB8]|nr:unnamed protein product [Symbiodinium sp. KB8]
MGCSEVSFPRARAAGQGAVPVVFGDLSDEELDAVLKDVAIATLTDAGSVSGWANIWYDVVNCCTTLLSSPKRQEKELGVSSAVTLGSIVAPLLLLAMTPIAVIRNLLVLGMEAPFSITAGLLLMGLLIPTFTLLVPARPLDTDFVDAVPLSTQPGWLNWVVLPSLALAILAVWRVQLRAILTDRDVHIAGCIADACNKYGGRQKVVLAVVGTLHLAGISRLAMIHSRDLLRANGAAMQELAATRIHLRARLARARAALTGGRLGPQTTLVDEVILANLQAMPKSTSSSLGLRVATALQRLLSARGVQTGRIRVLKVNSFKDGQRELLCDIGIPSSSSPCAVVRLLERALFTEEAQRPESVGLLHVLRAVSAQISTLKVEIRPSKERLVNSLRMAIPKTVILPRRVDAVIQARRVSGRKRACERTTLVSICGTDHS